ncbi:fungal-specific transcription factor domain-containing protein [Phyllosticta capitalensis]
MTERIIESAEGAFGLLQGCNQFDQSILSFWESQWGLDEETFYTLSAQKASGAPVSGAALRNQEFGGDEFANAQENVLGKEGEVVGAQRADSPLPALPGSANIIMTRSINGDLSKGGMLQPALWTQSRPGTPSNAPREATAWDSSRRGEHTYQATDSASGTALPTRMPRVNLEAVEDHYHVPPVSKEVMHEIAAWIEQQNAVSPSDQCVEADAGLFNRFVQLYFEYFHPVVPILHKPSFNRTRMPWMLVFAVAAVGGEYAGIEMCKAYVSKLQECLRSATCAFVERHTVQTLQVWFAQVVLLSQVTMIYSGSKPLILTQQMHKNLLLTLARGLGAELKHETSSYSRTSSSGTTEPIDVGKWCRREQSKRVIWAAWMLDVENALHLGLPTIMPLCDHLDLELPCPGDVWNTRLDKLKEQTGTGLGRRLTLRDALQVTHDSSRISDLDDFQRRIVLLAVYQESRDLVQAAASLQRYEAYLSKPNKVGTSSFGDVDAVYDGWRSRTVEALAVESAETSKVVGPTRLSQQYYHVVCIQLFVPLSRLCACSGWMATEKMTDVARREVSAWLAKDLENSRRAVMHAAILFNMMRDKVNHAHGEAHHLLLAALTLWTYATFGSGGRDGGNGVVRLDQASGAETKMWLQDSRVVATVGGVGSIEGREGGRRVLAETRRIMASARAWPVRGRMMEVLDEVLQSGRASSVVW